MFVNASNNAVAKLSSNINSSQTTLTVDDASIFPDAPFLITVNEEIMRVTSVSGNSLTVQRGREGTSASSHNAGNNVENNFTAGTYQALVDEIEALKQQSGIAEMGENENGSYIRYENGIQMCWHALLLEDVEIDNSSGSVYRSGPYTWDFPKSFIDDVVNVSLSSSNLHVWSDTTGDPVNGAPFRLFSGAERSISSVIVMCMAIGRWK